MAKRSFRFYTFCIYSALMLGLLLIRELPDIYPGFSYWDHIRSHVHLIPFTTTGSYIHLLLHPNSYLSWMTAEAYAAACTNAFSNLGGNVILFVPLGFLLPRIFPRLQRLWKTSLCALLVMTCVELLQLFALVGYCDVDDLILNTVGAVIGYGLHKLAWTQAKRID